MNYPLSIAKVWAQGRYAFPSQHRMPKSAIGQNQRLQRGYILWSYDRLCSPINDLPKKMCLVRKTLSQMLITSCLFPRLCEKRYSKKQLEPFGVPPTCVAVVFSKSTQVLVSSMSRIAQCFTIMFRTCLNSCEGRGRTLHATATVRGFSMLRLIERSRPAPS